MKLTDLRDALLLVGVPVYHFEAPERKVDQYIVWAEDSQGDSRHADNGMIGQSIAGSIDYFTRTEYDDTFRKIQRALTVKGIPYRLNSVQRERDTGYIHYEWIWEVA